MRSIQEEKEVEMSWLTFMFEPKESGSFQKNDFENVRNIDLNDSFNSRYNSAKSSFDSDSISFASEEVNKSQVFDNH